MATKVFIIAEVGVNHNGELDLAKELVLKAKESGADAAKFQTFVVSENHHAIYSTKEKMAWAKSLEFSKEQFKEVHQFCRDNDILFLSTPFDCESVDVLEEMEIPIYKIASTGLFENPLLKYVAQKGKPIILSTGMAKEDEISNALQIIDKHWTVNDNVWNNSYIQDFNLERVNLLYCVSLYPALYEHVDLMKIQTFIKTFQKNIGFSDHTKGIDLPLAAVGLGARIIEKHLKLSEDHKCPDDMVSLTPMVFKEMVDSIRHIELAIGNGNFDLTHEEMEARKNLRKGFFASRSMKQGEIISEEDLILRRPAGEIGLEHYDHLVGTKLIKGIKKEEVFTFNHLES